MRLGQVIEALEAQVLAANRSLDAEIDGFCISDRISDLLVMTSEKRLVVTHLMSPQVVRVADLLGAPAVCMICNAPPNPDVMETLRNKDFTCVLLTCALDAEETRRRLSVCLAEEGQARR